jgi:hypothetical protein
VSPLIAAVCLWQLAAQQAIHVLDLNAAPAMSSMLAKSPEEQSKGMDSK